MTPRQASLESSGSFCVNREMAFAALDVEKGVP